MLLALQTNQLTLHEAGGRFWQVGELNLLLTCQAVAALATALLCCERCCGREVWQLVLLVLLVLRPGMLICWLLVKFRVVLAQQLPVLLLHHQPLLQLVEGCHDGLLLLLLLLMRLLLLRAVVRVLLLQLLAKVLLQLLLQLLLVLLLLQCQQVGVLWVIVLAVLRCIWP